MNHWQSSTWLCSLALLATLLASGCNRQTGSTQQSSNPEPASAKPVATEGDGVETASEPPAKQPFSREDAIEAADQAARGGRYDEAISQLQRVLTADSEDAEALFRLSRVHADAGDLQSAVELLDLIPEDHPEAGLPALGQAADWYMALEQFDQAETRYQKVLAKAEGFAAAHRQLAYLYNRQGRRHEAAEHLRVLCRLGNIQQDELHALMVLGHAILDDPNKPAPSHKPYYPIGPAAQARMLYTASRFAEAIEVLDDTVKSGQAKPSIMALYGLLAVEVQDRERFLWWLARAEEPVKSFAEYWAAVGGYLLSEGRFEEAARALAEALDRDPTDIGSMRRINQALTALGQIEQAERWSDRYVTQRDVTLASNEIGATPAPSSESYATVANGLDKLQRPLEASIWRLLEAFHRKAPQAEIEALNQRRAELARSDQAFPSRSDRLCQIDFSKYPLPNIEIPEQALAALPSSREPEIKSYPVPKFTQVASQVGLNHTYRIATQPQRHRFTLYQSLGGGIAVLDYDLDGWPDLYLAQGHSDPPGLVGTESSALYRNVQANFVEATEPANASEYRYSIGVTAGDWNQDGFDDLVIGNIGNKVMLINNGDGTFRRQEFDEDPEHEILISSLALADVSGDALPDLVALYYVEDKTMVNRPKLDDNGLVLTISPASFRPGTDRILTNDGRGGHRSRKVSESPTAPSTGLGVVIADWDGKPGNEIFVGNDVRPNHLWVHDPANDQWVDTAVISGCAHGHGGMETASMGIAVADFDGNGLRDIHITNFYLEPVSLFMNQGGTFQDRCVQYKLQGESSTVLGFGCQAIDYNNDGRPDLAVTNGNIEEAPDEPLQQSPQFFVNLGTEFQVSDVEDPTGYWQGEYLGRGMARLDFNRDGRQDFLITHLDTPSALMANQTETDNHYLTVELVGVDSERDAISAQVQVHAGEKVWTNWIVGGDGYLCRNEPTVSFGLGEVVDIDQVVVTWPTGQSQSFTGINVDQRILVVEGQSEVFSAESAPSAR